MDWISAPIVWFFGSFRNTGEDFYAFMAGQSVSHLVDVIIFLAFCFLVLGLFERLCLIVIPLFSTFLTKFLTKKIFMMKLTKPLKDKFFRLLTLIKFGMVLTVMLATFFWVAGVYFKDLGVPNKQEFERSQAKVVVGVTKQSSVANIAVEQCPEPDSPSPESQTREALGQMGDFFGGVLNPILAFASFIALLYTIKLQSKEMEETREELKEARIAQQKSANTANTKLEQEKNLFEYQTLQRLLLAQVETLDETFSLNAHGHSLAQIQDLILSNHFRALKSKSTNSWLQMEAIIEQQLNIARTSTHASNYFLHVSEAKSLILSCSIFASKLGMVGDNSMLVHTAKKVGFHCCISSFTMAGRTNILDTNSEVLANVIANYWKAVSIDPIDTPNQYRL